ncbi:hypothetical protein EH165_06755 [Nakamurella antarctica]|uniref:Uncharacterized protein n=1 Tax=Nakamurella antarctica TaxID=1902245 RepID=A0A3G8ZL55_9ACTN|nr:hypothetical protein [Nakamurella antarctica]AZI57888.1 hypothetical protein EH165_06755 [Nakamurella antarctica]
MNATPAEKPSTPQRAYQAAVILASLFIPIALLTGKLVELIMDSSNPDGLTDLTAGLAYLTQILVWSFTVLGVAVIAFVVATVIHYTRTRSFRSVALPVGIALIQLVIGVALVVISQAITEVDG